MSLKEEIWAAMADATGIRYSKIAEIGRRTVEAGYFPRHSRRLESQTVGDRDLANLTTAVLRGGPSAGAPEGPAFLGSAEACRNDHIEMQAEGFLKIGHQMSVFLEPRHSFIDGLAALFGVARQDPERFLRDFNGSWVKVEQMQLRGTIELQGEDWFAGRTLVEIEMEYEPSQPLKGPQGDMEVWSVISTKTIASVAAAAGLESLPQAVQQARK